MHGKEVVVCARLQTPMNRALILICYILLRFFAVLHGRIVSYLAEDAQALPSEGQTLLHH